jgi:predicted metalloprotease with PDZ domain
LTVRFLGEEIEKDYFDKILIDVKAVCDGFYYYGCDFDKNRIINIRHDSQAYMAGLRDGDKIVAINGYKIVNNTMLGRVMACKAVTFETKDGKVVTLEGVYFSPEEVRARYLGY